MGFDGAVVGRPVVRRDHDHAIRPTLLRVPRQSHGLVGGRAGTPDQHGNAAVHLADNEWGELAAFVEGEMHDLTGAAQREDPVHAPTQQELDVTRVGTLIDAPALVKQGDDRRNNAGKAAHRTGLLHSAQIVLHVPPGIGAVFDRHEHVTPHTDGATDHFGISGHLPAPQDRRDARIVQNPLHQERLGFASGLVHPGVVGRR